MTFMAGLGPHPRSWDTVAIRRATVDDFADLRHVHSIAMRAHTVEALTDGEVAAFVKLVYSPLYGEMLTAEEIYGGWIDGQLIASASWHVKGADGDTARIGSVFVHPLFTQLGIGRRLLTEAEGHARRSGFTQLGACATANAVGFFERLGYQVASRGVKAMGPGLGLPVAFLRKTMPAT